MLGRNKKILIMEVVMSMCAKLQTAFGSSVTSLVSHPVPKAIGSVVAAVVFTETAKKLGETACDFFNQCPEIPTVESFLNKIDLGDESYNQAATLVATTALLAASAYCLLRNCGAVISSKVKQI